VRKPEIEAHFLARGWPVLPTKGLAMPRNSTKPKRKLKTHRGAAKRFKMTATGKLLRMHSGKRHLLGTKAAKRMRKLKKLTQVHAADLPKTRQMLPYGLR
jgi:large subunit ribosomal protein L35